MSRRQNCTCKVCGREWPAEVAAVLRDIAACSRADPMRKDPKQRGKRVTFNVPAEMAARLDAAVAALELAMRRVVWKG